MEAGWCLGTDENNTAAPSRDRGNFTLEVDEASDLSLLVAHVVTTLIEDKLGFAVNLVVKHHLNHSIEQVALGAVDASVEIQLTEARDQETYQRFVEEYEMALDMGPTGYSNRAGWYLANGHLLANEELCTHEDYWHTFTHPADLGSLLPANEVQPGRDDEGLLVCDATYGDRGFCPPESGKYFSRACTPGGYSVEEQGRPCRALLAHFPSYDEGVNEQLVNNLGCVIRESGLPCPIIYVWRC